MPWRCPLSRIGGSLHLYITGFNLQYPFHKKQVTIFDLKQLFCVNFDSFWTLFSLTFYLLTMLNVFGKVSQLETLLKISGSHQTLVRPVGPLSDACGVRACRPGARELSIKSHKILFIMCSQQTAMRSVFHISRILPVCEK